MQSDSAAQHKQGAIQHRPHVANGVKQYPRSLGKNGLCQGVALQSMIEDFCSEETARQPRSIFSPTIAPLGTDAFSPDHLFQRTRLADFAFGLERARDE